MAGWGSEPAGGEGHGGCYDNFVMVFDRYVSTHMWLTLLRGIRTYYGQPNAECAHYVTFQA